MWQKDQWGHQAVDGPRFHKAASLSEELRESNVELMHLTAVFCY